MHIADITVDRNNILKIKNTWYRMRLRKKLKTKSNDKANNQTKKVRYNSLFSFEDFFNKLFLVLDASAFAFVGLINCHF